MPFYTFVTKDEDVEDKDKMFEAYLSFAEYDKVMAKETPLIHPETKEPVKEWKRIMDNVNIAFAQPWESSKWDNFGYRAEYNLTKAKKERQDAQEQSHVGDTPYQQTERQYIEGGHVEGVDSKFSEIGDHDMANFEGKVV